MPVKKVVKKRNAKKVFVASPSSIRKKAVDSLQKAITAGKWMAVVFRVENKRLFMDWSQVNLPKDDIDTAVRMFSEDMEKLKAS